MYETDHKAIRIQSNARSCGMKHKNINVRPFIYTVFVNYGNILHVAINNFGTLLITSKDICDKLMLISMLSFSYRNVCIFFASFNQWPWLDCFYQIFSFNDFVIFLRKGNKHSKITNLIHKFQRQEFRFSYTYFAYNLLNFKL